jgi:hypothetical protein
MRDFLTESNQDIVFRGYLGKSIAPTRIRISTLQDTYKFLRPLHFKRMSQQRNWWMWVIVSWTINLISHESLIKPCVFWRPLHYLSYILQHKCMTSWKKGPSWEVHTCSASQEIPSLSWNPKLHYSVHNRPQISQIPRYPKWSFTFMTVQQNF